jgi:hypothetical protein
MSQVYKLTLLKVLLALPVFAAGMAWTQLGSVSLETLKQVWPATAIFGVLYGAFELWMGWRRKQRQDG